MAPHSIDRIFWDAAQIASPAEREAYLQSTCGDDVGLRRRVEQLLHARSKAEIVFESPLPPDLNAYQEPLKEVPAPALDFLAPSQRPDSLGRLGHFEVLEVVGHGGMGIVLRAFDEKLHRVAAIKVMAAQLATTAAARKRFTREAHAAAAVSHDQIVTIHAVDEANGLPYLVMQYVSGMSLQQRLDREGPLQLTEIVRIGMQTASGLAAAHAQGLIHRDIKPANILLENGVERVKITDFGLARAAADADLTQSGAVAGTPQYMSPEQAHGEAMDQRSDLFSLGSVLYAMCTGRAPFRASSSMAVLKRVCEETPPPIRESNPEIPDWLAGIIDKLHAKDPAARYQSAAEVAELLGKHLADLQNLGAARHPVAQASAPTTGFQQKRGLSRRWVAAVLILFAVLAALCTTEVTGVTHLAGIVSRIMMSGAGTPARQELAAIPPHGQEPITINPQDLPRAAEATRPTIANEVQQFIGHDAVVWSVAFSPDGSQALSGSGGQFRNGRGSLGSDFSVRLWDVATAQQLHSFAGHQHHVQSVAFTSDGRHALGAGKIWAWRRWDVETGHELPGFSGRPAGPFFYLALSGDATRLLSFGGTDKVLRLWDVAAESELWRFEGLAEEVSAAAFSRDGRHVATAGGGRFDPLSFQVKPGSDYSIRIWDAASGKEELRLRGHTAFVRGLAFLPDGRRLLSGGSDNVLRLWDLQTRQELHVYQGHSRGINAIALSPDGRYAISGSADTIVRLWDIETGKELCHYMGHTGEVRCVAISPDCRYALSGGYDETVRLWQLPEPEK